MVQAQNTLIPELAISPSTGMEYLNKTYPYILTQDADTVNPGNWTNNSRNTFIVSSVPGYTKETKNSGWNVGSWTDYYLVEDSFVLDNQNRLSVVIDDTKYNYPGYTNHTKLRYQYTYDANGKLTLLDVKTANPATTNNYVKYMKYVLLYDANGRRLLDSLYYTQATFPYLIGYEYNSNNKVVKEAYIDTDPAADMDSANIMYYSYAGSNMLTSVSTYYDATTSSYLYQGADTFTYDAQNRVIKRISYGLVSYNGSDFVFTPSTNETYSYNAAGKLEEIKSKYWLDSMWYDFNKTTILYDAGDQPFLGYIYPWNNGNYSTKPSQRLMFTEFSGIKDIAKMDDQLIVYPNPASESLNIKLIEKPLRNAQIHIVDITGKTNVEIMNVSGSLVTLDISSLSKGIYFMQINDGEQQITRKLMVK